MKRTCSILLALVMLLSLCACGSTTYAAVSQSSRLESASEAPAAVYDTAVSAETVNADFGGFGMTAEASAAPEESASGSDALPDVDPDKIIYSADATVETTDFDTTVSQVAELVGQYKGWIESSSINGSNYYSSSRGDMSSRSAYYTIRIPSTSFNEIMNSLSTLGNVPYTHTYTENVTSQYYDTSARLTAYQTQEARLLEMMEKADTVEDTIKIEDKLTELRYQIESLQSTLKNWDRQVSYSTISLDIEEVCEYTPETPAVKPSYGQRLLNALSSSLRDIGEFFSELLVWLVSALPVLLVLAATAAVIVIIVKRCRGKRRAKKDAAARNSGSPSGEDVQNSADK